MKINLKPNEVSWCDAWLDGELLEKVLKVCKVGQRCHITGLFVGHGDFNWTKIISVKAETPDGWVKSADVECNVHDECDAVDNYTDAGKRGHLCATFAVPVYDRPNGKIVGSLFSEFLIKRDAQRNGFTHVKSEAIDNNVIDFSGCG